jgi:RNA recognition motif-containing protein
MTEAELLQMFSGFGTITKLAMAGDTTVHAARFAFVEFSTVAEAHMALAMNGTILGDRYPVAHKPFLTLLPSRRSCIVVVVVVVGG